MAIETKTETHLLAEEIEAVCVDKSAVRKEDRHASAHCFSVDLHRLLAWKECGTEKSSNLMLGMQDAIGSESHAASSTLISAGGKWHSSWWHFAKLIIPA